MAYTNYGILFAKGDGGGTEVFTTIGSLVKITIPTVKTEKKESTSHASSGKRTFLPSGLLELEDFTVTLLTTNASMVSIYSDMKNKTVANYKIDFDTTGSGVKDWVVSCFPLSIKMLDFDAQSPDSMKFEVSFAVASLTGFDIIT